MTNGVFRIDDRLIHGQVIVGWVKRLRLNCIIVANDEAATDYVQKSLMALAIPQDEVKSFFWTLEETVVKVNSGAVASYHYILLVNSVFDAYKLIDLGLKATELNIGGLHFKNNKSQYSTSIFLDETDIDLLEDLQKRGIKITAQPLPDDSCVELNKILPRKECP